MNRISFVVPWFGESLTGGAEQQLFQVTARLASRGHSIEVLTTCCRSPDDDWQQNKLPEGQTVESGITVHRFPVRHRDSGAFLRAQNALADSDALAKPVGVSPAPEEVARAFIEENIQAPKLLEHLQRRRDDYQSIVFSPYQYGPTLLGIELAGRRAILQPWLRDETRAYLPAVANIFDRARKLLFQSEEEAMLAARLFGPAMLRKGVIVGMPHADPSLSGGTAAHAPAAPADWDGMTERYEEALELHRPRRARRVQTGRPQRAIHQLLPSIDYGDAISNQAVFTAEVLRELGCRSEIFVLDIGEPMRELAHTFTAGAVAAGDGLLYHHAIGTALTAHAVRHRGPKALLYHNITPAHFFEPWDRKFAGILEMGRKEVPEMARHFPVSAGDSLYNAEELRAAGFRDPAVVPIFVDPMRWNRPADPGWMKTFQDGRTNILFVGRVAPNKCQHHLLEAFREYLSFDANARLVLVGVWPEGHPYARFLRDEAERLGITQQVFMTWRVTDAQLLACYRTAHLFWSMSEHEGFCVPLIEAMWFDIPVLAYRSSAIPETLGPAGIMFTEKGRWPELAALAHLLVEERDLRRKVIEAQRKRREAFLPEAILPSLLDLLGKLGSDELRTAAAAAQPAKAETTSEYPSMIKGQR